MNKSNKFSPEVRERAVRMAQEHRGEYPLGREGTAVARCTVKRLMRRLSFAIQFD
ncbi:MAG TPA: hypothetical protein VFG49_14510 [Dyella sp.]|uniref:hypothetical protein n=1 Tax=Dyella sp. TaxID=1869338 RepID=UPI002D76A273|nr:hypothetical protein [Dyella sp.]HET6554735.1 hypothetical protein [Dyella sp.]